MPYTSFENDAAKDFKVYASLSDDVPLTTVNAYGASWAIEVSNAGSTGLKVTKLDGSDETIPSANWVVGQPKFIQATALINVGTDATGIIVYWR